MTSSMVMQRLLTLPVFTMETTISMEKKGMTSSKVVAEATSYLGVVVTIHSWAIRMIWLVSFMATITWMAKREMIRSRVMVVMIRSLVAPVMTRLLVTMPIRQSNSKVMITSMVRKVMTP